MASPCNHEQLNFGSGGYYIFCHACGATWDPSGKDQGDNCENKGMREKCMTLVCQTGPGETGVRKKEKP